MKQVNRQKGMTGIGMALIIALIGIVTLVALKLIPIYIDGYSVIASLESLENEHNIGKKTPTEIKSMLMKRLDINIVKDLTKDNIYIERSAGKMAIEIDYEVRENLVGNLDVVVVFNDKIEVPSN